MLDVDADLGFPGHVVLPSFTLKISRGEGVGLVGRNGSGKTTLLRTVAGLQLPRSGHVLVSGQSAHLSSSRLHTGFVPDPPPLYEELSPWEHLELVQRLWSGRVADEALPRVVGELELEAFLHQRCDTLSLGMRKRLSLALALLHGPALLLLDEPFNGLDAESTLRLQRLLRDHLQGGGAFIASSHQPAALRGVATRTHSLSTAGDPVATVHSAGVDR